MSVRNEKYLVARLFEKALDKSANTARAWSEVQSRLERLESYLDIEPEKLVKKACKAAGLAKKHKSARRKLAADVLTSECGRIADEQASLAESDALEANLAALIGELALTGLDAELVQILGRTTYGGPLEDSVDGLIEDHICKPAEALGWLCNARPGDVEHALQEGPLAMSGIVCKDGSYDTWGLDWCLTNRVYRAVTPARPADRSMADVLLGPELKTETKVEDYEYLGDDFDVLKRLIAASLDHSVAGQGLNILLYGPPGSGKTSLAAALASSLGARLHAVGEKTTLKEPARSERLAALALAQSLAARQATGTPAMLLFDELGDLVGDSDAFGGLRFQGASKVFFNRTLETNRVPTIWTVNNIACIDPAVLRRFTWAMEVPMPNTLARRQSWLDASRRHNLELDKMQADRLARDHKASHGTINNATRVARLASLPPHRLPAITTSLLKAERGGHKPAGQIEPVSDFNAALVNADRDIAGLGKRLVSLGAKERAVSLLFYGPPGTGKSESARWIAGQLGMDILQKRASDLKSKWVGETEANIAEAFEEARQNQAFLLIDEADSFLGSRDGTEKSWEVSMVNEMLICMERHPLPFACTTNLLDRLDAAAVRRFTVKLGCDFLGPDKQLAAWDHFFPGIPLDTPLRLDRLAVFDFALVKRRLNTLGEEFSADLIRRELTIECGLKPGGGNRIGF